MSIQAYERRSKNVKKEKESMFWQSVTADMMSDEERRGDVYIRHQPEYRSEVLTSFINKVDERSSKNKVATKVILANAKRY